MANTISFCLLLALLAVSLTKASANRQAYIVTLRGPEPTLAYKGGYQNFARTAGFNFKRSTDRVAVDRYGLHLENLHLQVLAEAMIPAGRKFYSYTHVLNGFAVSLTKEEVTRLELHPNVGSVVRSRTRKFQTISTPAFLRLGSSLWKDLGGQGSAGEDIIIGVIDSGVWPENPSFKADVEKYGPPPRKWKGYCNTTADFPASSCNNKLIGAKFYYQGLLQENFPDLSQDFLSPRDVGGHGSHTTSTAGGNKGVRVTLSNVTYGIASGMAPRARVAAYKVGFQIQGQTEPLITTADIVMAIDDAVDDGVDVINFSIGGIAEDNLFDPDEVAYLLAAEAGVFVAASAGNDGVPNASLPIYAKVAHPGPWLTTVAAGTHDRFIGVTAILGSGKTFLGASLVGSSPKAPLITGTAAALPGAGDNATLCFLGALDPKKVKGKIVLCLRGVTGRVQKGSVVKGVGGVGMILRNAITDGDSIIADFHVLPATHVTYSQGLAILLYATSSKLPACTLSPVLQTFNNSAPMLAGFSSVGPIDDPANNKLSGNRNDIIKPDVMAPGVSVWAAYSPGYSSPLPYTFNLISGTSMASPHIAGIGALMKQRYPDWSPYAIKSALQTTASLVDNKGAKIIRQIDGQVAVTLDFGSGEVTPSALFNPGLVYDETSDNMVGYMAGVAYVKTLSLGLTGMPKPLPSYNLNLATIGVSNLRGSLTLTRTVTSVGTSTSTYVANIQSPAGIKVTVSPFKFSIAPGQSVTYLVTVTVLKVLPKAQTRGFVYGSLIWRDGIHSVYSPLAIQPLST